jgi:hypothetical protein
MNTALELIMRSLAIFLGTFFTSRWFITKKANLVVFTFAFIMGLVLNYYGPLKL